MNLPNEDIPVRVAEDEAVEANTEYDPECCVRNDSDENEIELSDENIWYDTEENDDDDDDDNDYGKEPTFYDSGMWAGDYSFDHTMKQTRLLMTLLMHLLLKPKFMTSTKKYTEVRCENRLECSRCWRFFH